MRDGLGLKFLTLWKKLDYTVLFANRLVSKEKNKETFRIKRSAKNIPVFVSVKEIGNNNKTICSCGQKNKIEASYLPLKKGQMNEFAIYIVK